jgi:uncharacterized protein
VLGWLYNRTGSILAVAVWHATYNVTAATDAAHGMIAAVSTTVVIIAAASLIIADVSTHGRVLATAEPVAVIAASRSGPTAALR